MSTKLKCVGWKTSTVSQVSVKSTVQRVSVTSKVPRVSTIPEGTPEEMVGRDRQSVGETMY